ncbi:MAG: MATE family efflux transporter [Phycisphaerales bacterium]
MPTGQPTNTQGEHTPLGEMLRIAAPVAATMASYTVAQFVDRLMVSRLENGDAAVAAQGNGSILSFVPISLLMGMMTVVNTFVAQNVGAKRPERAAAYPWAGLWICLFGWALLLAPLGIAMCLMEPGLTALLPGEASPDVVRMQEEYSRILLVGSIITLSGRTFAQFFYGIHRPRVVMSAAIIGTIVNALANYALIYGNWGFPRLEVAGAAYATLIGQVVELAIPMALFLSARLDREYGTRRAWRFDPRAAKDILRIGWPAAVMFTNEMACWAVFLPGYLGSLGVAHNSASWIGLSYMHVSFLPAMGLSIAVTALVGKRIGAGKPDEAAARAWLGVRVAMLYMGTCALIFVLFRGPLVELFIPETLAPERAAEILDIGKRVMIAIAIFQLFDAVGITMVGALRGAGDTTWPGIMTAVLSWSLIIGLGALLRWGFPEWGSMGPWSAAAAYIIAFALTMLWRFRRGAWRSIKLVDSEHEITETPPPEPMKSVQA